MKHWLSCSKFTVQVNANKEGIITWTAPITRKFVGKHIDRLRNWMQTFGGYVEADLKTLHSESAIERDLRGLSKPPTW